MGEDASRVVFRCGFRYLPEGNLHFTMCRRDALDVIRWTH